MEITKKFHGGVLTRTLITKQVIPVTHDTYNLGANGNAYSKFFLPAGSTGVTARVGVKGFHQYAATADVFFGMDNVFPTYAVQKTVVTNSLETSNKDDYTNFYQGDSVEPYIYTNFKTGSGAADIFPFYVNVGFENGGIVQGLYDATNSLGGAGILICGKAALTGTYLCHDISNTRFNIRCSNAGMGGTALTSIGMGGNVVVDVVPIDALGALRDDAIDLGLAATGRWKNLFLSNTLSAKDAVLDKAAGTGIKIDLTTPTFGFADLLGDQFSKNTGATKPTLAAHNGACQAWQFGDGDEAFMSYHIPHDYVAGTDIHLHIHWSQTSGTATGGTIDFKYTAEYAKGHNQASGSTFTATPITATFSSIDINDGGSGLNPRQQHLTEVIISAASATAALFDRDDFEPDGVIELTLEMVTNSLTNSVAVLDPFIHFADIHYQTTGIIGTKDKVPNFYT